MSNERRGSYANAIWSHGLDIQWAHALGAADAAMALADAEIYAAMAKEAGDAAAEARDEIDRLNRELTAANARQRATWDLAQRRARRIFDLQGEKGELRDDLAYAERRCKSATEGMRERDALIQRVREVLNNAGLDDIETGFFQDVRDALEGEG